MSRILGTILILILILFFPYWLYAPALLVAVLAYPLYWEGIILALLIDVLYGARAHEGITLVYPFAIGVAAVLLLIEPVKRHFRFNV